MKELKKSPVKRDRGGVQMKEPDHMKDLENDHVENLLEDLNAHIRVVGGFGLTESLAEMTIEQLARHLFPNGVEFRIHNRRLVPDPLKEE